MLALAIAAAVGAGAAAAWFVDLRLGRGRNEQGKCAACGRGWAETQPGDPHLIHGRLVCEECADRAKRRMIWHFGVLVVAAAVATGSIVAAQGVVALALFPAGATVFMTFGAAQLMRLANRDAQRRIAMGEFPSFKVLEAAASTEPVRTLPEGPVD